MGSVMAVPPPSHGIASLTEVILPRKGTNVFIAPGANVMGDVKIGDNSSIWYNAVLRGTLTVFEKTYIVEANVSFTVLVTHLDQIDFRTTINSLPRQTMIVCT